MANIENLRIQRIHGTTSATLNTETTHAHGLVGALIVHVQIQEITTATACRVYLSKQPDNTNIYVKPNAAVATEFDALILYMGGQA